MNKKLSIFLAAILIAVLFSVRYSPAAAANLTIPVAGRVTIELITSQADFSNTLSVISPTVAKGDSGCKLEPAVGLTGVHILSEKKSQHGCRVDLDADPATSGIQGFAANTTFEFGLCAQTDADPNCEFVWSSNPSNNSDNFDHVQTTTLSPGVFQLAWEDLENGGDMDFNDLIVVVRVQADTDGDGLWDDWEQSGIDTDGDGTVDFNLPALGANPNRKDIFLEIDFMNCAVAGGDCAAGDTHNHQPKMAAINAVIAAFANAPVPNPDGSTGITLHVEVDDGIAHQNFLALGCGFGNSFDTVKANPAVFGPDNPRRFTHHYAIFGHRQAAGTSSSGCGERPGNDFIVTLGEWNTSCIGPGPNGVLNTTPAGDDVSTSTDVRNFIFTGPNLVCNTTASGDDQQFIPNGNSPANDLDGDGLGDRTVGTVQEQAGTLMHEFGHNLQLCHGGVVDPPMFTQCNTNFKPNYLSIMNYAFQTSGIPPTDPDGGGPLRARIDFSNDVLPSCIGPGGNGVLNTTPAGDDTVSGNFIRSGPNRTCNTTATGDDVQFVANGNIAALVENSLNETVGIGDGTDSTRYFCPNGVQNLGQGIGPIDWNCNGDGGTGTSVSVDVTREGTLSALHGWDDWDNIRYTFQNTGDFEDGVHDTTTNLVEIDFPTHLQVTERIGIDIKPFSDPNSINTKGRGVVPVAICNGGYVSNSLNIDDPADPNGFSNAATNVDVNTIRFALGSNGAPEHNLGDPLVLGEHLTQYIDTNADNIPDTLVPLDAPNCSGDPAGPDLIVHIPIRNTGLAPGQIEACLTAQLTGGKRIIGCDSVNIIR